MTLLKKPQLPMKTTTVSFLVAAMLLPAICLAEPQGPPKVPAPGDKGGPDRPDREFFELWKAVDVDNDGAISKAEFDSMARIQKLPDEKRANLFTRLDKDNDGNLSREELLRFGKPHDGQPMKRLWELDSDKSGGINFDEFKAGQLMKKLPPEKQQAVFNRLDTDGDGLITPKDRPENPYKRQDGKLGMNRPEGKGADHGDLSWQFNRKLDVNGDGSLSFSEFREGSSLKDLSEDEQEDRFERLDRNDDQKISPEDFQPPSPSD